MPRKPRRKSRVAQKLSEPLPLSDHERCPSPPGSMLASPPSAPTTPPPASYLPCNSSEGPSTCHLNLLMSSLSLEAPAIPMSQSEVATQTHTPPHSRSPTLSSATTQDSSTSKHASHTALSATSAFTGQRFQRRPKSTKPPSKTAVANLLLDTPFPLPLSHPAAIGQQQFPFPPNASPAPPPQKRTSNLSMLLNGPGEPPLRKQRLANLLSPSTRSEPLPFSDQQRLSLSPKAVSASLSSATSTHPHQHAHPLRNSFEGSKTNHLHISTSSLLPGARANPMPQTPVMAQSHILPRSGSSTLSSSTTRDASTPKHASYTAPSATSTFTPPKLPYNPNRITPSSSVLRPLTDQEARSFVSRNRLRFVDHNDSRPSSDRPSSSSGPRPLKGRSSELGDNPPLRRLPPISSVKTHYDSRPEVRVGKCKAPPITGLKSFNNWITSVLISKYAGPVLRASPNRGYQPPRSKRPPPSGKVLDLGCGKGGDLQKWSKANIMLYVGLDTAAVSVRQARERWQEMQRRPGGGKFDGFFSPLDCYSFPLSTVLSRDYLIRPFDVVSLQFCMHYAFESEAKARMMLGNVSEHLREGGVFIGATLNAEFLMDKLAAIPPDATDLTFGNDAYSIKFDDRKKRVFGQRYHFYLRDAVEDVPEYVVHWREFEQLALEYNLQCECQTGFHELFEENREIPEFRTLLKRMKVVDENGETRMGGDQWEAASMYLAFVFVKRIAQQPLEPFLLSDHNRRPSSLSTMPASAATTLPPASYPPRSSSEGPLTCSLDLSMSSLSLEAPAKPISQSPIAIQTYNAPPSPGSSAPRHASRTTPTPTQAFTPPRFPYNPNRITPSGNVLRPLTAQEAQSYVSPNRLRFVDLNDSQPSPDRPSSSFGRTVVNPGPSSQPGNDAKRPFEASRDTHLIHMHYQRRSGISLAEREESPIIGLKCFNNWVKAVLIMKHAVPALRPSLGGGHRQRRKEKPIPSGRVLDLGCGRGGDLKKWSKANISSYVGLDVAVVFVVEAHERWQEIRGKGKFEAFFAPLDRHTLPISSVLPLNHINRPFDVVSLQFCMHYAFEREAKARMVLRNVSEHLRDGGVFIGTIPNSDLLLNKLAALPQDATDLTFGNDVYSIRFDDRIQRTFGQRYLFHLKDAVEDVPEYVVHWREFEQLALEYGLHCECRMEFRDFFRENREIPEFRTMLQGMKVVDRNGESRMDEEQWEAANVYLAFVFVKKRMSPTQ